MTTNSLKTNKLYLILDRLFSSNLYLGIYAIAIFFGWLFNIQLAISIVVSFLMLSASAYKRTDGLIAAPLAFAIVTVDLDFASAPVFCIIFTVAFALSFALYFIRTKPKIHFGPSLLGYLIFVITLVLGSLVSHIFYKSITIPTIFYILALLLAPLMYFLTSNSEEPHMFRKVINTIVAFGLLVTLETITFYLKNPTLIGNRGSLNLGWSNANTAGIIMIIGLIASTYYLHLKGLYRFFVFLGLPIILGVLLTISRQNIYSMCIFYIPALLIGFLTFGKYKWVYFGCTTVGIILFVLISYLCKVPLIVEIIEKFIDIAGNSSGRGPLVDFGLDLFSKNIFFGQGVQSLFGVLYYPDGSQIMLLHSTIVTTLACGGLLSFVGLATYYGLSILDLFHSKNILKYLVLIILIMSEFIGLVDNSIYNVLYQSLVMMLLGGFSNRNNLTLYPKLEAVSF